MKLNSSIAAAVLVASGVFAAQALAQAPTKAAEAQRLKNLKDQRDAKIAAAKARQNTIQRPVPTATPTVAPTTAPTTPPTVATIARPTPTAVPTTTPTTTPTTAATGTVRPTGAGGAPAVTTTPATSASALPKAPPAALSLDIEELKKTRPDRRKAEFDQLRARWGGLLRDQRASTELKLHAQRTAFLQRIRALASKSNDAKTVQAVDILITKEDTRNADAMNALRSGALPTVAAEGATK